MKLTPAACFLLLATYGFAITQTRPIVFLDATGTAGLNVPHISTAESRYIIESMSGGVALIDCDADGFLDVATVNGSSVENFRRGGDPFLTLYRQIGGAVSASPKFENITTVAGLNRKGWGMGVTAVDFNSDGWLDLFVTGFNGNAVFRGTGPCKFEDVTESTGLKGAGFMTGAAWSDFDRDGDLDAFIAGYVNLDLNNLPVFGSSKTCSHLGIRVQCGPRGLPGERDWFFRNKGNGTFEEVPAAIGTSDPNKYFGLGAIFTDYDNDGWPDLYVANDSSPNYLYRNLGRGRFEDVSFESGTSYGFNGQELGSMGVASGDYDNDGDLDLFVTNFETEPNSLYRNQGDKGFLDVSTEAGIAAPSKPLVGWGTSFSDFDCDGWLDLLVVNGHVYPQMEMIKTERVQGFKQPLLLHRNLGNGRFEDVSRSSGISNLPMFSGRGAAFGDLNNDGLIDVIVTNLGDKPTVLMNASGGSNSRVMIRLIAAGSIREAIGARVTLRTNTRALLRESHAGSSYLSQNDLRFHFGFPRDESVLSVEVRWNDGTTESVSGVVPNQIVTITQGKGVTYSQGLRQ